MSELVLDSAYDSYNQENMKEMEGKSEYEGDNEYIQYKLPPLIQSERMLTSMREETNSVKERAFTIANKAREAMMLSNNSDAIKMSYEALSIDPFCVDGWLVLCKILFQMCDGDTVLCNLREILHFSRNLYKEVFDANNGMFYSIPHTRPYIRILTEIGSTAFISDQLNVAIYAYEEILRLNHKDNTGARDQLLACYLKIIGRTQRFPSTQPKRTIEQAEQLMYGQLNSQNIFEENNLTVRWAKLCFAYLKNKNWKEIAKEEYEKNDLIFKVVFDDLQISDIPPSDPNHPQAIYLNSKSDDVRAKGEMIKESMADWPNFVIELCKFIKNKVSSQFQNEVMSNAPNPDSKMKKEHKTKVAAIGQQFLNQGRADLTNRRFSQAIEKFSMAKRGFYEASKPSPKWYLNAPFAIVSNRATAAAQLGMWDLVRMDTRFTLLMKPDHERTYLKLPQLARAFKAKQLIDDFEKIAKRVENHDVKDIDDWKKLARKVIGFTSISAIAFAAEGILTKEKKDELIETGINDCYCPINVGPQYSLLPWLTPEDIDPEFQI